MDLQMITSDLKFVGSHVQRIELTNNHPMLNNSEIGYGMDIDVVYAEKNEDSSLWEGTVILAVGVQNGSSEDESHRFNINYQIEGCFSASETLNKEDFISMLYVNGGASLYSLARADILTVSAIALHNEKIRLPMINIVQYLEEKAKMDESENINR